MYCLQIGYYGILEKYYGRNFTDNNAKSGCLIQKVLMTSYGTSANFVICQSIPQRDFNCLLCIWFGWYWVSKNAYDCHWLLDLEIAIDPLPLTHGLWYLFSIWFGQNWVRKNACSCMITIASGTKRLPLTHCHWLMDLENTKTQCYRKHWFTKSMFS